MYLQFANRELKKLYNHVAFSIIPAGKNFKCKIKKLFLKCFWLFNGKHPGDIKSKIDITIPPVTFCFGNKPTFKECSCIGEV